MSTTITNYLSKHSLYSFIDPLVTLKEPTDPEELKSHIANKLKTSGIIIQHLDNNNKILFATDEHFSNPRILWKSICFKYASKEECNQAAVFLTFLQIPFSNLSDYVNETHSSLSKMSSMGCDMNEKYLAEIIVSKLPDSMNTTMQILHEKQPLTIATVLENLDTHVSDQTMKKKIGDAIALSMKSASTSVVYCKDGKHNKLTRHSRAKFMDATYSSDESLLDSACSLHMTSRRDYFSSYEPYDSLVEIADGTKIKVIGQGEVIGQSQDSVISF
ncbi:hypothetical protein CROQUDRAFT_672638 [Cronartium quercuum f. sp. fusiforme G11]|uniref:Retrovirus-related Pol polyprotein from transposon TNT 1-94-like beta-barrel domain-containing protein n=1 Tax=Cronartium quercuum f. sp. fusiforme G11 TaxID=708437 RepID=A0A9P6NDH0_9BASI|nr:hypothetical protein CROQUDRAFT_672638 [Cronartium quercuum f. sp. fusiforme G11]